MYTLRAILISRQNIRDNRTRTIVLTSEYGKITVWEKKPMGGDIGSLLEMTLERKNGENKVHKSSLISLPKNDSWDYETTLQYLSLFQLIKSALADGCDQGSVFADMLDIVEHISHYEKNPFIGNKFLVQLFILTQARILKKLGFLNKVFFIQSPGLLVIYERLDIASMKSIIYPKRLVSEHYEKINASIREGIHTYLHRI